MSRAHVSRETKPSGRTVAPVLWSVQEWVPQVQRMAGACELSLRPDQVQQLAQYMALLQQWNGTYNLTALRQPQEMLTHHLADCLVVVPSLMRHLDAQPLASAQVLDVGSGGGLPGVVLAVVCEGLTVTCVDTVGKKAAFIRQVAVTLALPRLKAVHARVESMSGQFDVITSRAFASLSDFISWTAHLRAPTGCWMAMKGVPPDEAEQAGVLPWAQVSSVESLQVPELDAQRCLVWLSAKPADQKG